ncbi:MAG: methylenetetrahydrofolate reductase C-terminal domain-containing protein [Candidatus Altiarchaeota archaeon]
MIITEKKPYGEVLSHLKGCGNVAVLGCGRCATTCQTGGEAEVAEMVEYLKSEGISVEYSQVVEAQCDQRLAVKAVKAAGDVDAFVSMACGSGASALADLTEKTVVPSNNTLFLGVVRRIGEYDERCSMCGDCTLTQTAGVCVKTRCSKKLLNGPCGGSIDGKCEVGGGRECAWGMIVKKLKSRESVDDIKSIREPSRISENNRPRRMGG